MTGWDILDTIIKAFPPIAAVAFFLVAGILFAIGFFQHGLNFIKYGFTQKELGDLGKKIDDLRTELKTEINDLRTEVKTEVNDLRTELEAIKVNHFGHLKNFLTELTSILLDKGIINNENKARLDNQLHGM
jgi:hypothetical protein